MACVYHGKDGGSQYSSVAKHHDVCISSNGNHAMDYLESTNFKLLIARNTPVILADFGTGDAMLALATFKIVIAELRKTGVEREVVILLNDEAGNDWSLVLKNIQDSRVQDMPGVTVFVTAKDFLTDVYPAKYIDFCTSVLATQSTRSLTVANELFPDCENVTDEERLHYREQFGTTWQTFLSKRSREMKPGGRLTVSFMLEGSYSNGKTVQLMSDAWTDLYSSEALTRSEFQMGVVKSSLLSEADILSPFENETYSGFKVKSFNSHVVTVDWGDNASDVTDIHPVSVYAEKMAALLQSWTRGLMMSAFDNSSTRTCTEKEELLDRFYQDVRQKIQQNGGIDTKPFIIGQILLQKLPKVVD